LKSNPVWCSLFLLPLAACVTTFDVTISESKFVTYDGDAVFPIMVPTIERGSDALMIKFSSDKKLQKLYSESERGGILKGFGLDLKFVYCDDKLATEKVFSLGPFAAVGRLQDSSPYEGIIVLEQKRFENWIDRPIRSEIPQDLLEICLSMTGGTMMGFSQRSNRIEIPDTTKNNLVKLLINTD